MSASVISGIVELELYVSIDLLKSSRGNGETYK